jgi:O-antigen/teichoic acid export membrane protein
VFKNIVHSLVTKGLVAVINFIILIFSSKYLGVSSRGEISILILNIAIIQIINEIFTGYSLVYFIPNYNLKKLFVTGVLYTLAACSLSNTIFYIIKKQLPNYELASYVISLIIILNTFNCVIILGKEKIKLYNFLNVIQPVILLTGLVISIVVLKNYTFTAYFIPMFISFIVAFFISITATLKLISTSKSKLEYSHSSIFITGLYCQIAVLMHIACNRYSYYLLPNSAEVGLYSSASSLIESILIISNGISPVLLSKVANQGNTLHNQQITLSLSKVSFILSIIGISVIAILPNKFFIFMLGNDFSEIKYYMLLYAPGILMVSFSGIISHYFSALGKLKTVLMCNSFGFIATISLAPYLIKKYDIEGAAIIANIAYFLNCLVLVIVFFGANKLSFSKLISFKNDITALKLLIKDKQKDVNEIV